MKRILFLAALILNVPDFAAAADRATEADLFGGEISSETAPVMSDQRKRVMEIGGNFSTQGDFYLRDDYPLKDTAVSNPNVLFLYFDSKFERDARLFARFRTFYDPTGTSGGIGGDLSNPYGSRGKKNAEVSLHELKFSANLDRKIFLTAGRQKVKYGAAKYFNPTDFLNSQPLNFFLPSDERVGVDMIKAHIPSGSANFYAARMVAHHGAGNQSGSYLRSEIAYDGGVLGSGEVSMSGFFPRGRPTQAGFDISQSMGRYDVYLEGAVGRNSAGRWKSAYSGGASRQIRYADRASNVVTLHGEFFYARSIAQYGVFSLSLPEPGSLKDVTFANTTLYHFRDKSALNRLDMIYTITPEISGQVYAAVHAGKRGGVFHQPGQVADVGARLDFRF